MLFYNKFIEQAPGLDPGASAASTIKVPESRGPNASVVDFFLSFDEEIVEASKSFTQYEEIEVNKKIEAIDYEFTDPEAFAAFIETLPIGAFLYLLFAHSLGTLISARCLVLTASIHSPVYLQLYQFC